MRILALHYSKHEKCRLYRIDYGVKYQNRNDKYVMVQASHKKTVTTDFNVLREQFDNMIVKVNEKDHAKIHHTRFIFYPDTRYYNVLVRLVVPAITD